MTYTLFLPAMRRTVGGKNPFNSKMLSNKKGGGGIDSKKICLKKWFGIKKIAIAFFSKTIAIQY